MAIIPCIECGHHVSDQAASCPSCGVPIAPAAVTPTVKAKPRAGRGIARVLITLMVLWTLGTVVWLVAPNWAPNPNEWMTRAKLFLQPAKHATVTSPPAVASAPTQSTVAPANQSAATPAAENQHAPAAPLYKAQLYKGDAIHVECDKVSQSGPILQGSGCNLAFVDPRTREVNLALILANESGAARVYVVGPMSQADCQARGEEISGRLQGKQGEHLVWKNCSDAARESLLPAGCNLGSSSVALAEIPTAHVWRYDCGPSNVAHATTTSHKSRSSRSRGNGTLLTSTAEPVTTEPEPAVNANIAPTGAPSPTNIRLASADGAYIGGATTITRVPAEEPSVAHPPQSHNANTIAPQGSATTPDDLARVRAKDPAAANHIAAYCLKTAPLSNRDALVADCRRNEAEAYTRLVLQNEFPTLDEATRKKCSEPPFPDTYVAKESCARYSLRTN